MAHTEPSSRTHTATYANRNDARSASSRVYEDLRARIVNLELLPDSTLSRVELTEEYAVSQTPIREALQRLEQDGLIRIFPQSRTVVTRIDKSQLDETQFLRVALETEVVRRLATSADPAALTRIRSILKMQETLAGDPDQMEMFSTLDKNFHRTLFESVGMYSLYQNLAGKLGHLARCQHLELPKAGRMEEIMKAHWAILAGIESGNPDTAANAMREHVTGTILRVAKLKEEFPDYFI